MKTGMVVGEEASLTEEIEPFIKDKRQESAWCFTGSEKSIRELCILCKRKLIDII